MSEDEETRGEEENRPEPPAPRARRRPLLGRRGPEDRRQPDDPSVYPMF